MKEDSFLFIQKFRDSNESNDKDIAGLFRRNLQKFPKFDPEKNNPLPFSSRHPWEKIPGDAFRKAKHNRRLCCLRPLFFSILRERFQ